MEGTPIHQLGTIQLPLTGKGKVLINQGIAKELEVPFEEVSRHWLVLAEHGTDHTTLEMVHTANRYEILKEDGENVSFYMTPRSNMQRLGVI